LTWQQGEISTEEFANMTWYNALSYCEGLTLGGNSDWRLPNIKELESITDYTTYDPAINTTFFPDAQAYYYWSSTTNSGYTGSAWDVFFGYGNVYSYSKSYTNYVRCVRGEQAGSSGNLTLWVSE